MPYPATMSKRYIDHERFECNLAVKARLHPTCRWHDVPSGVELGCRSLEVGWFFDAVVVRIMIAVGSIAL